MLALWPLKCWKTKKKRYPTKSRAISPHGKLFMVWELKLEKKIKKEEACVKKGIKKQDEGTKEQWKKW